MVFDFCIRWSFAVVIKAIGFDSSLQKAFSGSKPQANKEAKRLRDMLQKTSFYSPLGVTLGEQRQIFQNLEKSGSHQKMSSKKIFEALFWEKSVLKNHNLIV